MYKVLFFSGGKDCLYMLKHIDRQNLHLLHLDFKWNEEVIPNDCIKMSADALGLPLTILPIEEQFASVIDEVISHLQTLGTVFEIYTGINPYHKQANFYWELAEKLNCDVYMNFDETAYGYSDNLSDTVVTLRFVDGFNWKRGEIIPSNFEQPYMNRGGGSLQTFVVDSSLFLNGSIYEAVSTIL